MRRFPFIYWLPVLAYYGFITYLSGTTPDVPAELQGIVHLDKLFHLIEYSVLGLVLARDLFWQRAYRGWPRNWCIYFFIILLALITLDEWHQSFTPNRMPDVYDGLVDVVGGSLGLGLFWIFVKGRSGGTDKSRFAELENRDRRIFAVLLLPILYFVFASFHLLRVDQPLVGHFPFLGPVLLFLQWTFWGYMGFRAYWICQGERRLRALEWAGLMGFGLVMVCFYGWLLSRFQIQDWSGIFVLELTSFVFVGLGIGMLREYFVLRRSAQI